MIRQRWFGHDGEFESPRDLSMMWTGGNGRTDFNDLKLLFNHWTITRYLNECWGYRGLPRHTLSSKAELMQTHRRSHQMRPSGLSSKTWFNKGKRSV